MQSFRQAEQLVRHAEAGLQEVCSQAPDEETRAEEKILLAEYALDFAQGAANRALLVCMNAMDADLPVGRKGYSDYMKEVKTSQKAPDFLLCW